MKFVATAPDVPAVAVGQIEYTRVRRVKVNCPICQEVFYLWTSLVEPKPSEIDAAVKELTKLLIEACRKQRECGNIIKFPERRPERNSEQLQHGL